MRTADFDYHLPPELIAQSPAEPRDSARLLVLDRGTGAIQHRVFRDLVDLLEPGDRLVANASRVIPARLRGRKTPSGGRIELLLLRPAGDGGVGVAEPGAGADPACVWECLIGGRVRPGTRLAFGPDPDGRPIDPALPAGAAAGAGDELAAAARLLAEVVKVLPDGRRVVRFDRPPLAVADRLGEAPLPPYIHRRLDDRERYQTVYARTPGSAAAPTAGLHFTPALIDAIASRGVGWSTVTLHIGLDTFRPVEAEHVADHRIHREWAELDPATAAAICATRRAGGRIVAVGTTAVRVLETAARQPGADPGAPVAAFHGWTDLFITPGFAFRAVDALITNFHLPRSSLLMLVAAFAGKAAIDRAYAEAVRERYRFYSFGDAMWIGSSTASTRRAT